MLCAAVAHSLLLRLVPAEQLRVGARQGLEIQPAGASGPVRALHDLGPIGGEPGEQLRLGHLVRLCRSAARAQVLEHCTHVQQLDGTAGTAATFVLCEHVVERRLQPCDDLDPVLVQHCQVVVQLEGVERSGRPVPRRRGAGSGGLPLAPLAVLQFELRAAEAIHCLQNAAAVLRVPDRQQLLKIHVL